MGLSLLRASSIIIIIIIIIIVVIIIITSLQSSKISRIFLFEQNAFRPFMYFFVTQLA